VAQWLSAWIAVERMPFHDRDEPRENSKQMKLWRVPQSFAFFANERVSAPSQSTRRRPFASAIIER
jgi:hypothetical protein